MKRLKDEGHSAKIIKISDTIKNNESCILLVDKGNVDKLLNSLQEIDSEITKHLKINEASDRPK